MGWFSNKKTDEDEVMPEDEVSEDDAEDASAEDDAEAEEEVPVKACTFQCCYDEGTWACELKSEETECDTKTCPLWNVWHKT